MYEVYVFYYKDRDDSYTILGEFEDRDAAEDHAYDFSVWQSKRQSMFSGATVAVFDSEGESVCEYEILDSPTWPS